MSNPFHLIDGYNLLFQDNQSHRTFENSRQDLLSELLSLMRRRDMHAIIVWDAHSADEDWYCSSHGNVRVVYTDRGQTADEYITQELLALPTCGHVTVVTSDKGLSLHAKGVGAHIQSSSSFIKWMRKPRKSGRQDDDKGRRRESPVAKQRYEKVFRDRMKNPPSDRSQFE